MADEAIMLPNVTDAALTKREEESARLVAEDEQTDEEIAALVGVAKMTIERWKKRPDFSARVEQHREAFKNEALTIGFADKRARLKALNAMAQDIQAQIARSNYEREEIKLAANGEHVSFQVFDKDRVSAFFKALDDIAKELGERKTITDITIKDREIEEAAERLAQRTGIPKDRAIVDIRERLKARAG